MSDGSERPGEEPGRERSGEGAAAPGSALPAEDRRAPEAPPLAPPPAGSAPAPAPLEAPGAAVMPSADARRPLPAALSRGLALFLGVFTLANLVGAVRTVGFDANVWWIDLHEAPRPVALILLAAAGIALVAFAAAPAHGGWRRWATVGLAVLLAILTAWNGVAFYREWSAGRIHPGVPVPVSFLLTAGFAFVAWAAFRAPPRRWRPWAQAVVVAAVAVACAFLFPLAQVFFFGCTDYRRPADVAVVFGAQVHDDGRPSTSLRDRVATAVALYEAGSVHHLVMSGGVGASGHNEALVMREMAVAAGVPKARVAVDSLGVSTDATVADTVPFFGRAGWRRIVAVSQFYHLPRIKLAYQRAGWDVLTVPARGSNPIPGTAYMVLREIPAFWVYYLRAAFG